MVNTALSQNTPGDEPKMPRAGQADLNDLRYQRAGKISLEVVRELLPIKEIPHAWSANVFDHYLSAINAYAARDGYALPPAPVARLTNGAMLVTAKDDHLLFGHLVTAINRDKRYPQGTADQVLKQKMLSVDLKTYHEWVDLLQAQARYFHKNGSQYAARLGQMTGLLVASDVALGRPIIGAHPGHLGISYSDSNGVKVSLRESNRSLEIDHPLSPGGVVLVPYATFGTVGDLPKFAQLKDFRVVIHCENDFIYSVLDTACIELGLNHIQAVKSDLTEFFAHSKELRMVLLSHGEAIGADTLKKIAPLLADALRPGGAFICYNGDDPANGFGSWQLKDEMHSVGLKTDVELDCHCSKTDFSANRHQQLLALDGLGVRQAIQEHETKLITAPATLFRFVKE